jgi:hypothetical protein
MSNRTERGLAVMLVAILLASSRLIVSGMNCKQMVVVVSDSVKTTGLPPSSWMTLSSTLNPGSPSAPTLAVKRSKAETSKVVREKDESGGPMLRGHTAQIETNAPVKLGERVGELVGDEVVGDTDGLWATVPPTNSARVMTRTRSSDRDTSDVTRGITAGVV